ncbi:hsp90 co-chaperone Cdc37-like 1 isoform X2 [Synchiropus splendidus]|uniref:hsp90 co-chaperone Cdc37-like 1 isoform X2 n=1 Tax=Synchiropus splendidus TaxID=270530 RepID=UPI00237D9186|nr:hsp90 co-chaperone Cdc37-like 1 isoform X2 [Synchiropus splendidus]
MEWLGNSDPSYYEEGDSKDRSGRRIGVHAHHQTVTADLCDNAMASLCKSQQRCVKASVVSSWTLVEAQEKLCSLGVHSSESREQEHARTHTCPTHLSSTVEEWRHKESLLGCQGPSRSPELGTVRSWSVFDKSIINASNSSTDMEQDECKSFIQKYEKDVRHFGMLRRWDDSQRFLSELPQLISEESANYLILWCIQLQQEGKEALMEQVAHQAVVMQFILETASNSQQDPRGCFRQFFYKAKEGQDAYLDVFHTELEAFKYRLREHVLKSKDDASHNGDFKDSFTNFRVDKGEAKDRPVAEFSTKPCVDAGIWTNAVRWTKDESTDSEDGRMMETS